MYFAALFDCFYSMGITVSRKNERMPGSRATQNRAKEKISFLTRPTNQVLYSQLVKYNPEQNHAYFFLSGVFEFIIILDPLVRLTLLKTAIVLLDNCKILKYVDLRTLLQIASII